MFATSGEPLHPSDSAGSYVLAIHDTASVGSPAAPPIALARRNVLLLPRPEGGWEVDELISVSNRGDRTVVSTGGMPTWQYSLPGDASSFELGDSQVSAEDVRLMGTRVLLTSPLTPGSPRPAAAVPASRGSRRHHAPDRTDDGIAEPAGAGSGIAGHRQRARSCRAGSRRRRAATPVRGCRAPNPVTAS